MTNGEEMHLDDTAMSPCFVIEYRCDWRVNKYLSTSSCELFFMIFRRLANLQRLRAGPFFPLGPGVIITAPRPVRSLSTERRSGFSVCCVMISTCAGHEKDRIHSNILRRANPVSQFLPLQRTLTSPNMIL